jgi:MoxR-like ATPase
VNPPVPGPDARDTSTAALVEAAVAGLGAIILGKETQLRLCLACLLARGHLLIEDIPGVGKTTLAHALARTLGLSYQRIQFTSDLLPADVIGVSVWEPESGQFRFHRGPVFAQLVLADEVNRATPKAQSALLDYVQAIARYTRQSADFEAGISPRAVIALLRAAQAWALMHGHAGVLPEDVQAVLPAVVGHRLAPRDESRFRGATQVGQHVLENVPVP